ncbi:MAG: DUF3846 domain-containing protein [Candidatus Dormibacteraceae bacterium]
MSLPIRALRLDPDGNLRRVALAADTEGSHLRSMYQQIGCELVECVGLREDLDMWCDEEGKLNGSPPNIGASLVLQRFGIPDLIVGTALFTGGPDEEGGLTDLRGETAAEIDAMAHSGRGVPR